MNKTKKGCPFVAKKKHQQPDWLSHRSEITAQQEGKQLFSGTLDNHAPDLTLLEQSLPAGEQINRTQHPSLLIYVLAGAGLLERGIETIAIISGDCFTIPADMGFTLTNKSQTTLRILTVYHEH